MDDQDDDQDPPIFTAVSSSVRQLYLLLRCIGFAEKANVQITEEGLRFSVEETSVMEGFAFLDKSLFTTYTYNAPPPERPPTPSSSQSTAASEDETTPNPTFSISLPSLLETLQIFGLTDPSNSTKTPWQHQNPSTAIPAFAPTTLGISNLCRLYYPSPGSPLTIILTESSIRTTCDLTTYQPVYTTDIPFSRQRIAVKIIMRAPWLFDAINELASTGPEKLYLVAKMHNGKPAFALKATGPLGSATVEFKNSPTQLKAQNRAPSPSAGPSDLTTAPPPTPQQPLLETFQLSDPDTTLRYSYKFSLIQKAARAMALATKVSVRGDDQGVLSLQFMIEVEGGKVSFVEFHFVPLVEEEDDGDDDGDEEEEEDEVEED